MQVDYQDQCKKKNIQFLNFSNLTFQLNIKIKIKKSKVNLKVELNIKIKIKNHKSI